MWELGTCEAGNDDGDGWPYLGDLNQEVGAGLQGKCPGEVSDTESKTLMAGKQNVKSSNGGPGKKNWHFHIYKDEEENTWLCLREGTGGMATSLGNEPLPSV